MDAVILAAGEGKKLRPLTVGMPKVMLAVGNRPILEYVVESLVSSDIRDITMVVGYFGEKIKRYFGDGRDFGARIRYVTQKKQLGTAHALYQARGLDDFIVMPGDNIIGSDCIKMLKHTPPGTILAVQSSEASKYGVVERTAGGIKIIEKPVDVEESAIFTGVAHLNSEVFDIISMLMKNEIYSLPEVLSYMENLRVVMGNCVWKDAVYPWDLLKLNSYALGDISRKLSGKIEQCTIVGNVEVDEGTRIGSGTYIRGPVKIGKNVDIGPNSVIMPDTAIGEGVQIGAFSYIENSIIMDGATIDVGAYIKDAIVGSGSRILPRSSLLSGEFEKIIEGKVYRAMGGSVIGPRARVGAQCVISPGVVIGADARVGSMSCVMKDVSNQERVR
ncbi:MAG: NTP transferase domain-containing protein [Euryarchaeota archaeon]|nr:NTP transferase domain-containing protein [Euryarchaeota archaeon]